MYVFKVNEILDELDKCINTRKPFSLIRFGDGGIKLLWSYLNKEIYNLDQIGQKEGIPVDRMHFLVDSWRKYANAANFIDTVHVYYTTRFWPKLKNDKLQPPKYTIRKLKSWKQLYQRIGINNVRYCNPEVNYLSALRLGRNKNIIDLIRNRKICVISKFSQKEIELTLPFCKQTYNIQIVGQYQDHYNRCFKYTTDKIKKISKDYDLFLVAGGELGRIYSGMIKEYGGRSFDIGFMLDYWLTKHSNKSFHNGVHRRLQKFVRPNPDNSYELVLTDKGRLYKDYI